ncbi:TOMM precursor leader peptide-binding protein [Actinokineospora inagensis]|uniref:TOMM precursor leader peptide-binding protein n=1 Tax=Actinokineospora inagensis TaxID=103730 RepID=UPI0012FAE0E6|nr:TOMM precursor leader peptide-binding protein [Actinokineospora inagensis]
MPTDDTTGWAANSGAVDTRPPPPASTSASPEVDETQVVRPGSMIGSVVVDAPGAASSEPEATQAVAVDEVDETQVVQPESVAVEPETTQVVGGGETDDTQVVRPESIIVVELPAWPEEADATQVVPPESIGVESEATQVVDGDGIDATQVVSPDVLAIESATTAVGVDAGEVTRVFAVPAEFRQQKVVPVKPPVKDLRQWVRHEFGTTVALAGGPVLPTAKLAVVFGADPVFERQARAAKVRALTVAVEDGVVVVGPLAVPGEPGCAACARARVLAAAASSSRPVDVEATEVVVARPIPATVVSTVDEMLRAAIGGDRALRNFVVEVGDALWHKVIPLADCEHCGGADGIATLGLPEDEDDPEALLQALAGWVDPLTGVIPWVSVSEPLRGGPFVATAAPPHIAQGVDVRATPIGWGKGMTRHEAILSAVGEAVERYSASLPDPDRVVWARSADLDGEILDPREFALYEPQQYATQGFPYVPYDRRVDHPWVRGTWLGADRPVWVPAVFAFLAMGLLKEHLICQGTSNGLAAGANADIAAVSATLELVERDAMMSAWLTGAKGRFVELDDTLDIEVADVVEAIREAGPTVEIYLLPTSAYGSTAVALAIGDGRRWPGVAMGLGADRSPRAAIRSAVLELAQTGPHLAALLRDRHRVPRDPTEVRDMLDHAAYYFPPDRVDAFDRLRCGGTSRLADLPEPAFDTSLADLGAQLGGAGVRVAVVDVTSADVATSPFRVVRAVSPDLQPINYGFGTDRALVSRLRHRGLPVRRVIHPIW